jgi:hypothetical protein
MPTNLKRSYGKRHLHFISIPYRYSADTNLELLGGQSQLRSHPYEQINVGPRVLASKFFHASPRGTSPILTNSSMPGPVSSAFFYAVFARATTISPNW